MPHYNIDLTATAHLPGLDIEVVHRRSPGGDREEISINLRGALLRGLRPLSGGSQPICILGRGHQADLARSRACTDAALKRRPNAPKERL